MVVLRVVLLSLCLCFAVCAVMPRATDCPQGTVFCFVAPCQFATCPKYSDAVCVDNYCGGCNAQFYVRGAEVLDCNDIDTA